jgi:K+-sensing histidine kinase KdpD
MLTNSTMITLNTAAPGTLQPIRIATVWQSPKRIAEVPARNGVMVCLSLDLSRVDALLRKGTELARELRAALYLVHVETPLESVRGGAKVELREFLDGVVASHEDVGVVWLKARQPAKALLDFARASRVQRIVIGRGRTGSRHFGRVLPRLIEGARHRVIEIVGYEGLS